MFEPQVWVNYDMIRKQDMLDAAAKTIMVTSDPDLAAKHPNGLKDMDNMEFIEEMQGGNTHQLDTFPRNMQLFDKSISDWEIHAQQMGAANDAIMGEQPTAGDHARSHQGSTNAACVARQPASSEAALSCVAIRGRESGARGECATVSTGGVRAVY